MTTQRQQCERLLAHDESILMEAYAILKLGMWRLQGAGRVFLTKRRLLWFSMARLPLVPRSWYPRIVDIGLDSLSRFHTGGGVLFVTTDGEQYQLRLAERYWALWNPFAGSEFARIGEQWARRVKELAEVDPETDTQ